MTTTLFFHGDKVAYLENLDQEDSSERSGGNFDTVPVPVPFNVQPIAIDDTVMTDEDTVKTMASKSYDAPKLTDHGCVSDVTQNSIIPNPNNHDGGTGHSIYAS